MNRKTTITMTSVCLAIVLAGCDTIQVPGLNQNPIADAGPDASAMSGELVTLSAAGSTDPDGDSLSYTWAKTNGPTLELQDSNQWQLSLTPQFGGTYEFTVTVTDGRGGSDRDTVRVSVTGPQDPNPPVSGDTLPDDGSGDQQSNGLVTSNFNNGDEGWRLEGGAFSTPTAPSWSSEEHYVFVENAQFAYWIAPEKFKGDFSAAFGKALEFEVARSTDYGLSVPGIVLVGAKTTLIINNLRTFGTFTSWGDSHWINLDPSGGWRDNATDQPATANQIMEVLSNVSQLKIIAGGEGFSWIDNVSLGSQTQPPRDTPAVSTFGNSDEGWRLVDDTSGLITRPVYDPINGAIFSVGRGLAWRSPATFRGNFSNFLGKNLVMDMVPADGGCCINSPIIVLYGGGSILYRFFGDTQPTSTIFTIRLDETQWDLDGDGVSYATRGEVIAVLTNLQRIEIFTNDAAGLDRVVFGAD